MISLRLFLVGILLLWFMATEGLGQTNPPPVEKKVSSNLQSSDGLLVKVTAAGLGGFFAWMLTRAFGLLVLRNRLVGYAIVVVNAHLRQYAEIEQWLKATREKTLRQGHVVKLAAEYTVDELEDLSEMRPEGLKLLRKHELLRITALISRLKELEALIAGFCKSLSEYKSTGKPLTSSDLEFLQRKQDRVLSYLRVIPKQIDSLERLPLDYAGIMTADSLVTGNSAEIPNSEFGGPEV